MTEEISLYDPTGGVPVSTYNGLQGEQSVTYTGTWHVTQDQIKEGKERNQCDQHEARREENFLGQLAGNDAHLSSPSKKSGDDANTRGCTRREAISSCRRDE